MHVAVLKVIFVVQVLLSIIDAVLVVFEEPMQVPSPLAAKHTNNSKVNVSIMEKMATEHLIIFSISILLAYKACRVRTLFWLLQPH